MSSDSIAKGKARSNEFQWIHIPVGKSLGDVRANCAPTRKTGISFPLHYAAVHHADLRRFLKTPGPKRKGLQVIVLNELIVPGNRWTAFNPAFKYLPLELATYLWYEHHDSLGLQVLRYSCSITD
jgi:hypothetical protein